MDFKILTEDGKTYEPKYKVGQQVYTLSWNADKYIILEIEIKSIQVANIHKSDIMYKYFIPREPFPVDEDQLFLTRKEAEEALKNKKLSRLKDRIQELEEDIEDYEEMMNAAKEELEKRKKEWKDLNVEVDKN